MTTDIAQLRHTADLYAIGADRRDKTLWAQVLSEECLIEGPGFSVQGRDANLGSLDALGSMFRGTRHLVHQQVATIAGDTATGETFCTAEHLLMDADMILVWAIRYQDAWRRDEGVWRFTRRHLIVDWEETRAVSVKGEME